MSSLPATSCVRPQPFPARDSAQLNRVGNCSGSGYIAVAILDAPKLVQTMELQ